jgi:hypothetical protein
MACWTKVNPDSELYPIFGDRSVPILSIVPFVPRESGMPLCYMVLGEQLPDEIVNQLAQKIYETWQGECESLEMAREYVLQGIPLKTSHFHGAGTDDYFQMPHGAALNAALHMTNITSH